jgi:HK97 family phage prohead protease
MSLEVRSFKPEVRSEDGKPSTIKGYPIVFNAMSQDLGGFREIIQPGAVEFTDDVRADFNHDSNFILGRVRSGTLSVTADESGVLMEVTPPDTTWARDLMASIERGDIDQGSFAFRVLPEGQSWEEAADGTLVRSLSKISVSRVSVVADPAYTQTSMQVRSMSEILGDRPATGQAAPPAQADGGVENLRLLLELKQRQ